MVLSLKATPACCRNGVARQAAGSVMTVPVVMLTLSLRSFASITTGYTDGRPSGVEQPQFQVLRARDQLIFLKKFCLISPCKARIQFQALLASASKCMTLKGDDGVTPHLG